MPSLPLVTTALGSGIGALGTAGQDQMINPAGLIGGAILGYLVGQAIQSDPELAASLGLAPESAFQQYARPGALLTGLGALGYSGGRTVSRYLQRREALRDLRKDKNTQVKDLFPTKNPDDMPQSIGSFTKEEIMKNPEARRAVWDVIETLKNQNKILPEEFKGHQARYRGLKQQSDLITKPIDTVSAASGLIGALLTLGSLFIH